MNGSLHAYLIMAHNNIHTLNILLEMLDDSRNFLFIHLDKKSKLLYSDLYVPNYSKYYFIEDRIDVKWGGSSQIDLELLMFETALKNGPFRYYHLISGSDLPIKSQNFIHDFFNKNNGKEFIDFANDKFNQDDCERKVMKYYFFQKWNTDTYTLKWYFKRFIDKVISSFLKRSKCLDFKKGANWVSITQPCCEYIISKKDFIRKRFKYTFCGDEIFVQSLVFNSPFYSNCYSENKLNGCLREIDWKRGIPYAWTISDKEELQQSENLFARKILDENLDLALWIKDSFS